MQQRVLGCGKSPAYGPIHKDAEIWQAEKLEIISEDAGTTIGADGWIVANGLTWFI
jgi:hypothetical protein